MLKNLIAYLILTANIFSLFVKNVLSSWNHIFLVSSILVILRSNGLWVYWVLFHNTVLFRSLLQDTFFFTFTDLTAGTAYQVSIVTKLADTQSEAVTSTFRTCK